MFQCKDWTSGALLERLGLERNLHEAELETRLLLSIRTNMLCNFLVASSRTAYYVHSIISAIFCPEIFPKFWCVLLYFVFVWVQKVVFNWFCLSPSFDWLVPLLWFHGKITCFAFLPSVHRNAYFFTLVETEACILQNTEKYNFPWENLTYSEIFGTINNVYWKWVLPKHAYCNCFYGQLKEHNGFW